MTHEIKADYRTTLQLSTKHFVIKISPSFTDKDCVLHISKRIQSSVVVSTDSFVIHCDYLPELVALLGSTIDHMATLSDDDSEQVS